MLPVREMVLYKHGVGFFVRSGEVEGSEIELTFRQEDINDILKSLTIIDRSGGKILGIHYATPIPQSERLATTSFDLSERQAIFDLARDLRGRHITIQLKTGEVRSGIWLGVNLQESYDVATIAILQEQAVQLYSLEQIESLTLTAPVADDLAYYLHHSLRENDRRTVTLRLSDGKHNLQAHYVAPAPTWRVSYRVIADQTEGKLLLQGWGLFDNRLEEDLEGVKLTFVAGQPISFIYDLYSSNIPKRPMIQDEARVAPPPPQFKGGREMTSLKMEEIPTSAALVRSGESRYVSQESIIGLHLPDADESFEADTETQDSGELFQYIVNTPVTVKRGESALVPILSQQLEYERELLYNGQKLPKHPVSALRFKNTTGLTLERGPVTLVEDSDYKGEAVLPFSKAENDVYLPYAVELGINIEESSNYERESFHFRVNKNGSWLEEYETTTITYHIENTLAKAVTLLIEAAKRYQSKLFESPEPTAETLNEQRWQVELPAHSKLDFVLRYRRVVSRHVNLTSLTMLELERYLKNQYLDQALFQKMSELIAYYRQIEEYNGNLKEIGLTREKNYEQQREVRENLKALTQTEGEEGQLRARMLKKLAEIQDHLDAFEQQEKTLQTQLGTTQDQVNKLLETLNDRG